MTSSTRIPVSELKNLIGTPNFPFLVDVCIDENFAADPRLIPCARRHQFNEILDLQSQLQTRNVVVVCQKGLKLSQGAAAMLRSTGISAKYLDGGNHAWSAAGFPMIPADKMPNRGTGNALWVTHEEPDPAKFAGCWFIPRFIDPTARFLFVESPQILNVSEKFDAKPLNSPEHEKVFGSLLHDFELKTESLLMMASWIDEPVTQNTGIMALAHGLFGLINDDHKRLDAFMNVFDALYYWARLQTGDLDKAPDTANGKMQHG